MTRNKTYRSVSLAALVVVAAAVGVVAAAGTVAAQDAGNETGGNATAANATDESFYTPSEDDPLNVRFRDCCSHTVDSVDEGVLNLNIVYGMADGEYDVEITATGLSQSQIEDITFDSAEYDTNNLDRMAIVGMNFTDVPSGEYEFTVSVVGENASSTVPLEVTGESAAETNESAANETGMGNMTNATGNETTANATEMGNATMGDATAGNATAGNVTTGNATEMGNVTADNATEMGNMTNATGNVSISVTPSAANTTANYTVSVPVSEGSAGNLSAISVNYSGTNVSLLGVLPQSVKAVNITQSNGSMVSATGNVTAVSTGFTGSNLTIEFDNTKTVSAGDQIRIRYTGVTNPPEPGTYNATIDVNPSRGNDSRTATFTITQNTSAGGANATTTAGTAMTGTTMATGTAGGTAATQTGTAGGGAGTSGGTGTGGGGQQGTEAGGPGFGIAVAVIALLAAALLATRRS
jgi:PGF-CTERM protein